MFEKKGILNQADLRAWVKVNSRRFLATAQGVHRHKKLATGSILKKIVNVARRRGSSLHGLSVLAFYGIVVLAHRQDPAWMTVVLTYLGLCVMACAETCTNQSVRDPRISHCRTNDLFMVLKYYAIFLHTFRQTVLHLSHLHEP